MIVDELIVSLNEVAKRPSAESLRITTITNIRYVFQRIGIDLLAFTGEEEIDVKDHKYSLPPKVLRVEDVGFDRHNYQGLQLKNGLANNLNLVYTVTPREIYFPNFQEGKVWVKSWQFYTDEFGQPDIPDFVYTACYDYCLYKIASTSPTSPYWQDRVRLKFESDQSILIARGNMNANTNGSLRGMRRLNQANFTESYSSRGIRRYPDNL